MQYEEKSMARNQELHYFGIHSGMGQVNQHITFWTASRLLNSVKKRMLSGQAKADSASFTLFRVVHALL